MGYPDAGPAGYLVELYGAEAGAAAAARLHSLLETYRGRIPAPRRQGLSERDAILITYGDQVCAAGTPPLHSLGAFCTSYLAGIVSGIHILPFYPSSSDDGFSVIDYRAVEPALGDWEDVLHLGRDFRLMFDAVINHVSVQSAWFQGFLRDEAPYRDYFIVPRADADLRRVVRPRALPLLTTFPTANGPRDTWTTFSADQVDLNYGNPEVLRAMVDTLLFYAAKGAEFIRLDAIAYLWKEFGTSCISLPQTHLVIRLLRAALDEVAPHVMLITETNVPHEENLSYFGDGRDEAQMVYNFALPPLTLHAFQTRSAGTLARWAAGLRRPSNGVTFFNFLASHDGIGLNPARGILSEAEIKQMEARAVCHSGRVSFKNNPDGTQSAYELNINYWDALSDPEADEPLGVQVDRFMAAQAIMLALPGAPGIYFHSLVGLRGWPEGVTLTGRNRTINRQKSDYSDLTALLADPSSRSYQVFARYRQLLQTRAAQPAFDPYGEMQVLPAGEAVLAILRTSPRGGDSVLCLHNVSGREQTVDFDRQAVPNSGRAGYVDLLHAGAPWPAGRALLAPYQVAWLRAD